MKARVNMQSFIILFVLFAMQLVLMVPGIQAQRWLQRKQQEPLKWDTINSVYDAHGIAFELVFKQGRSHNHPLMVAWIEDMEGNYLQTIYIAESIGKGVFKHGDPSTGRWMPGPVRRPAALPYWGHQRGIRAADGYYLPAQDDPMPDGVTGPTPKANFVIHAKVPQENMRQFRVLFEVNQSWDWNEYWTNDKFPGDKQYMSSSQPALVYEAVVDIDSSMNEFELQPIGHSHWAGRNGKLYEDLSTITTALEITKSVKLRLPAR